MRIIRIWPVGLLVTAALGVGCGNDNTGSAETSAALTMPKASRFEAKVKQKNLLSDPDLVPPAKNTEPTFTNGWGIAFDPKTGFGWLASNGGGVAEVVNEDGRVQKTVMLPEGSAPTGVVHNPNKSFEGDDFIFATENGTIIGVKRNQTASDPARFTGPALSNFKGLTIVNVHGKDRLLIADFGDEDPTTHVRSFGSVVVLDDDYHPISDGKFIDPNLPDGYSVFNLLTAGNFVFATYAAHSADDFHDDAKGPGLGLVVLYTAEGKFITELVKNGPDSVLNSPWAMALKADKDDRKGPDLVVGNFGDGAINVFDLSLFGKTPTATFDGALADAQGQPLIIDGLWGFAFGSGRGNFDPNDIYFCAGPNGESNGLFGELDFITPRR